MRGGGFCADRTSVAENFALYYWRDRIDIDENYLDNRSQIEHIKDYLAHSPRIDSITIYAYASPEGTYARNLWLSRKRAEAARRFILANIPEGRAFAPSTIRLCPMAENWAGLRKEIEANYHRADRERVLKILDAPVGNDTKKWRLQQLDNGYTYKYIIRNHMPRLRLSTWICVWVQPEEAVEPEKPAEKLEPMSLGEISLDKPLTVELDPFKPGVYASRTGFAAARIRQADYPRPENQYALRRGDVAQLRRGSAFRQAFLTAVRTPLPVVGYGKQQILSRISLVRRRISLVVQSADTGGKPETGETRRARRSFSRSVRHGRQVRPPSQADRMLSGRIFQRRSVLRLLDAALPNGSTSSFRFRQDMPEYLTATTFRPKTTVCSSATAANREHGTTSVLRKSRSHSYARFWQNTARKEVADDTPHGDIPALRRRRFGCGRLRAPSAGRHREYPLRPRLSRRATAQRNYRFLRRKPQKAGIQKTRHHACGSLRPRYGHSRERTLSARSGMRRKGLLLRRIHLRRTGEYRLLTYNFGTESTVLRNENDYTGVEAYTHGIAAHLYNLLPSRADKRIDENIVYTPDHLFVDSGERIRIPYTSHIDTLRNERGERFFTARSMVKSYYMQIRVKGMQYVSTAVSLLTGMSGSASLHDRSMHAGNPATLYFEMQRSDEKIARDDDDTTIIYTTFHTFGKLPDAENSLEVSFDFITSDGRALSATIDITDKFSEPDAIEHQWILLDHIIEIPKPVNGGGGFTPGVDDWGDINTDILI